MFALFVIKNGLFEDKGYNLLKNVIEKYKKQFPKTLLLTKHLFIDEVIH